MFCGNCGKKIDDTSGFCPECGTKVEKEASLDNNGKYTKVFIEPDENFMCSLGNEYVSSFLTNGNINKCIALLSDKRVYLRGNMVDINVGKIERYNMKKTIDLEDITGTGFVYASPQGWKLLLAIMTAFTIILPVICIVSYIRSRTTQFFIEYAGGSIRFEASMYSLADVQDFEKQIRRAKDNIKGK